MPLQLKVNSKMKLPIYHLRYGELLMAQGFADKAKPYLEWAVRTDAESKFKNEAAERLAQMAQ